MFHMKVAHVSHGRCARFTWYAAHVSHGTLRMFLQSLESANKAIRTPVIFSEKIVADEALQIYVVTMSSRQPLHSNIYFNLSRILYLDSF